MATTTYCVRADIDAVLSVHGVDRMLDDDMDGAIEAGETALVTTMIERAASRMNSRIEMRYTLSDLSANDWMKFVNASIAAQMLTRRRGNGVPPSLQEEVDDFLSDIEDIRAGRMKIPEQNASLDYLPSVSNYEVRRGSCLPAVRVETRTSTAGEPNESLKRFRAFRRRFCG